MGYTYELVWSGMQWYAHIPSNGHKALILEDYGAQIVMERCGVIG